MVSDALDSWRGGTLGGVAQAARTTLTDDTSAAAAAAAASNRSQDSFTRGRWTPREVQRLETTRIVLLGRLGNWEESLSALDVMRRKFGEDGLDERAFVSAAHACAVAGKWSLVQVLQSEAFGAGGGAGVSPGATWEMRRALLSALATAGVWKRAMSELRDMHSDGRVGGEKRVVGGGDFVFGQDGREGVGPRRVSDPSPYWKVRGFGGGGIDCPLSVTDCTLKGRVKKSQHFGRNK